METPAYLPVRAVTGSEPDEERRHHHLIAQHEVVDDRVMAVELPSPRLGRRRLAHQRDVVLPLAVLLEVVAVELGQRVVQLHDVLGQRQAPGAQRRAQQGDRRGALRGGQLLEAHALTPVEVLIHPLAPLGVIDGERRAAALFVGEAGEEGDRRRPYRLGGHAGGPHRVEIGLRRPGGGDAPERLGEALGLGLARALGELLEQARLVLGGDGTERDGQQPEDGDRDADERVEPDRARSAWKPPILRRSDCVAEQPPFYLRLLTGRGGHAPRAGARPPAASDRGACPSPPIAPWRRRNEPAASPGPPQQCAAPGCDGRLPAAPS